MSLMIQIGVLAALARAERANCSCMFFSLAKRNTSPAQELRAGITTFLAMAYIIGVNPIVLIEAGIPFEAAVTSTCVSAGLSTILVGLLANRPLALAPGIGLNAIVAISITQADGGDWKAAMTCVFIEGICLLVLVLLGLREAVLKAIPASLRHALAIGLGLFVAFIGLVNAHIVVANPDTYVAFGNVRDPELIVGAIGIVATFILHIKKVPGDILLGIIIAVLAGIPLGVTHLPEAILSAPDFSSFGAPFAESQEGVLELIKVCVTPVLLTFVFSLLMTDFFDTIGSSIVVAKQGKFLSKDGEVKNLHEILVSDSCAAILGGYTGASSITVYLESSAGAADGGRTGLTSLVTGVLFLGAAFFAPLLTCLSAAATAGALVLVGYLMIDQITFLDFKDPVEAISSYILLVTIPLTYSIYTGIGLGFITYVLLSSVTGRIKRVHPFMWIATIAFVISFLIT